jgi:hypothetical protein
MLKHVSIMVVISFMLILPFSARAMARARLDHCSELSPHDQGHPKSLLEEEWNRNDWGLSFGPVHHGLEGSFLPPQKPCTSGGLKRMAKTFCACPDPP